MFVVGFVEYYWFKFLVLRFCVEGDCFFGFFFKLVNYKDFIFILEYVFLLSMVFDIVNEWLKEVFIFKDIVYFVFGLFR